jgi:hypothetical protein
MAGKLHDLGLSPWRLIRSTYILWCEIMEAIEGEQTELELGSFVDFKDVDVVTWNWCDVVELSDATYGLNDSIDGSCRVEDRGHMTDKTFSDYRHDGVQECKLTQPILGPLHLLHGFTSKLTIKWPF